MNDNVVNLQRNKQLMAWHTRQHDAWHGQNPALQRVPDGITNAAPRKKYGCAVGLFFGWQHVRYSLRDKIMTTLVRQPRNVRIDLPVAIHGWISRQSHPSTSEQVPP